MSKKEQKLPNFLGDEFLFTTSRFFLVEAGLQHEIEEVKERFVNKIMADFIPGLTKMILNRLQKDQIEVAVEIAKSGGRYKEREAKFSELIPSFKEDMSLLMDLFREKIHLGVYFEK